MDRHTAKGSQLSRRDSVLSHVSQTGAPGSASPETSRAAPGYHQPRPGNMYPGQDPAGSHYPHMSPVPGPYVNGGHTNGAQHPTLDTYGHDSSYSHGLAHDHTHSPVIPVHPAQSRHGSFSVSSPVPNQQRYGDQTTTAPHSSNFVSQQNVMSFSLPASQYSNGHGVSQPDVSQSYGAATTAEYSEQSHQQSSEMMMLGQMAMPGTVPMFGSDTLNKSPYVGMPEDFLSYLFNTSSPGERSPMSKDMMQGTYSR